MIKRRKKAERKEKKQAATALLKLAGSPKPKNWPSAEQTTNKPTRSN
jgi:hypothetical protein